MSEQQTSTVPPLLNRFMSLALRSPFHFFASKTVMLITFTGRMSGKAYTTPISYDRHGDLLHSFTSAKWRKNLVGGAPVTVNIKNKVYQGQAEIVADPEAVAKGLQAFLGKAPMDAKIHQVKIDDDGQPNWDDCLRAAERCDMIRIRLNGNDAAA